MKHTELSLNMLVERRGPKGASFKTHGKVLVGRVTGAPFLHGVNHYYVHVEYAHPVSGEQVNAEWKVSRLVQHADRPATDDSDQQSDSIADSIV
jgi:hypothetical protein